MPKRLGYCMSARMSKNISDESCGIPHLKWHNQLPNDVAYLLLDQLDCDKKKNQGNAKRGISPCLKFDPMTLSFDLS